MSDEIAQEATEEITETTEESSTEEQTSEASGQEDASEEQAGVSPEEEERRAEQSRMDKLSDSLSKSDERTDALLARHGYTKAAVENAPAAQTARRTETVDDDPDGIVTRGQITDMEDRIVEKISGQVRGISQSAEINDCKSYLVQELAPLAPYLKDSDRSFGQNFLEDLVGSGIKPTDAAIYTKEILQGRALKAYQVELRSKVAAETAEKVRNIKSGQTPKTASAASPPKETEEVNPIIASLQKEKNKGFNPLAPK